MGSLYGVDATGLITTAAGIKLPTTGGTQTTLDYNTYEAITFQMTGAVTPTFDFFVRFSRVGRDVVMEWDGFSKTRNASDYLFTAELVPARFRPVIPSGNAPSWVKRITDGTSLTSFSVGLIGFGPTGNITIGRLDQANFSSTYVGIDGGSISYIAA